MRPLILITFLLLTVPVGVAAHADKLTEANMTEKDFKEITHTESSEPGASRYPPPEAVHNFSDANEQAVKDAHGAKVVKGRDWKTMSPKDRDKKMGEFKKTMKYATQYVIEVPSGDVWAIDETEYTKLINSKDLKRWTKEEQEKLPKAVKRGPSLTHSDRSGTPVDRFRDEGEP